MPCQPCSEIEAANTTHGSPTNNVLEPFHQTPRIEEPLVLDPENLCVTNENQDGTKPDCTNLAENDNNTLPLLTCDETQGQSENEDSSSEGSPASSVSDNSVVAKARVFMNSKQYESDNNEDPP